IRQATGFVAYATRSGHRRTFPALFGRRPASALPRLAGGPAPHSPHYSAGDRLRRLRDSQWAPPHIPRTIRQATGFVAYATRSGHRRTFPALFGRRPASSLTRLAVGPAAHSPHYSAGDRLRRLRDSQWAPPHIPRTIRQATGFVAYATRSGHRRTFPALFGRRPA